jgi:hypothetical protein
MAGIVNVGHGFSGVYCVFTGLIPDMALAEAIGDNQSPMKTCQGH